MTDDLATIRAKLTRGEALTPGEVSVITGISRTKIHNMLKTGKLPYGHKPASRHRLVAAAVVKRLLDQIKADQPPE